MSGYVFIGNSTKPSLEVQNSRDRIKLDNVAIPCIEAAIRCGYKVVLGVNRNNPNELICEGYQIDMYDSHTYRSIIAVKDNYIAYKNLKEVIKKYNVSVIHCNTPVGGMIGRFVGHACKVKTIIYTVHGFHFYKGANLINRTIYKWAEQIMAHWTDAIITMNQEDYESAQRFKLRKGGRVFKVHGVGINLFEYGDIVVDKQAIINELHLKETDVICISAGDIVGRKNYSVAIEAIAKLSNPNLHYLICGVGPEEESLKHKASILGVQDQIHFLGFRRDVKELMKISDIFLFTSLQEGLPRSLMEAMASGLPVVASRIRGNVDLIKKEGGLLVDPSDIDGFAEAIDELYNDKKLRLAMGNYNLEIIKDYDVSVVKTEIDQIYREVLL